MNYNIDPELLPALEMLPDIDFSKPAKIRKNMGLVIEAMNANLDTTGVIIEDKQIPGADGSPEINVRIYSPENLNRTTAGLIYIHGGGFVIGNLESEHAEPVQLCQDLGIVLVSVDYRLAPENPYPAGLEDCYGALCWTKNNAEKLQIDVERLGVAGTSAGGGLAASLALLARDRQGPALCFQLLAIPELDDRLQTHSVQTFTDTPMWNYANANLSWQYYLGKKYTPGGDNVPYTAAPARATRAELEGLPPAYISTMEFDPLRDEGIEYAMKLLQAGVAVELHSYPGTFHGSVLVTTAAVTQRQDQEVRVALRRGLQLD